MDDKQRMRRDVMVVGSYVTAVGGMGPRGVVVEIELDKRGPEYDILCVDDPNCGPARCSRVAMRLVDEPADAPDGGLTHDDWVPPPAAVVLINQVLQGEAIKAADLRSQLAAALRERDEARAERDALLEPIWQASVPEPPPVAGGALVTPLVLAWLSRQAANVGAARVEAAQRLVLERDAFGVGKYGQGLSFGDGRSTFEDLRQELGDALQYGYKLLASGEATGEQLDEVRWLAHVLWLLVCAEDVPRVEGGGR